MPDSTGHFARLPFEVLSDPRLSHADVRVYAAMASRCITNNIYHFGQGWLAKAAHVSKRTVRRSIEKLSRRGHLATAISRLDGCCAYELRSPVFLEDRIYRMNAFSHRNSPGIVQ